jgi:hypothetical protein
MVEDNFRVADALEINFTRPRLTAEGSQDMVFEQGQS